MPTHLLPIKHRLQEEEFGCLAACAEMALSALSISVSQRELNKLFDLRTGGVPLTYIQRAERYGVKVTVLSGDERNLQQAIDQNLPPVLFVRTNQLTSYWQDDTRHALVVVGYDETHLYLNDPAFPDAPKGVLLDEVMLAWLEFDYMYALITK